MLLTLAQWLQSLSPDFGFFRVFQSIRILINFCCGKNHCKEAFFGELAPFTPYFKFFELSTYLRTDPAL